MNYEDNHDESDLDSINSLLLATQPSSSRARSRPFFPGAPGQPQFAPELFEQILDDLTDGIYSVDTEMRITYMNAAAGRISGYDPVKSIGCRCEDNMLVHIDASGRKLCNDGCPMKATLSDGKHRDVLAYLKHRAGHRVPVELRIAPMHDAGGQRVGAVQVFNSASTRFALERRNRKLEEFAYYDTLTGLANRRKGKEVLDLCLYRHKANGVVAGLLYADIDHFKRVNDVYGHDVGDQVLKMVAHDLRAALRDEDAAIRWGGEEFLCILPEATESSLSEVGERLRTLTRLSYLDIGGDCLSVTLSVGAALVKAGDTADSWLGRADRRLYLAKTTGRDQLILIDAVSPAAEAVASR